MAFTLHLAENFHIVVKSRAEPLCRVKYGSGYIILLKMQCDKVISGWEK